MHLDHALINIVLVLLIVLGMCLVMKKLQQPNVVGYLIAGMLCGPEVLGLFTDEHVIGRLGAIGVVLLMFFVGLEVSPKRLMDNWKVAVFGTLLQIIVSIGAVWLLGHWLDWPMSRIILLGFVISLSSTAVVLNILQSWGELDSETGQDVLGVLLVQDLAVVPMLIILGLFSGEVPELKDVILQAIGGVLLIGVAAYVTVKETINLRFIKWITGDQEQQVFTALGICFGFALLTGLLNLSTALGAFVAGLIIASAKETDWVRHALEPFRVIFIALFFVSIGMVLELEFIREHGLVISLLVAAVMLTNTFINAVIFKGLGESWKNSLYGGAILSQLGEFSFVLAAVGVNAHIITNIGYQYAIATITFSLFVSPIWIKGMKRLINK